MAACNNGHIECVKLLLDREAVVDQATNNGWTSLMVACNNGHIECVKLLLDREAVVDQVNE